MRTRLHPLVLRAALLAGIAIAPSAACTFPTVEYTSSDAAAPTTPPPPPPTACNVSTRCAGIAQQCGAEVAKNYESCTRPCAKSENMSSCLADCSSTRTTKLGQCATVCENCGHTDGCADAAANCAALVGK